MLGRQLKQMCRCGFLLTFPCFNQIQKRRWMWGLCGTFANQGPHVLSLVLSKVAISTAGGLKGQCLAFLCKLQILKVWWHHQTIDMIGYLESIQTIVVSQAAKLCACVGGMLLSMVTQFAMETWKAITWTLNTSKM